MDIEERRQRFGEEWLKFQAATEPMSSLPISMSLKAEPLRLDFPDLEEDAITSDDVVHSADLNHAESVEQPEQTETDENESSPYLVQPFDDSDPNHALLVTLGDVHLIERNASGVVVELLELSSVLKAEVPGEDDRSVSIYFDYLRKDRRKRRYVFESAEQAQEFSELLAPLIDRKDEKVSCYQCLQCSEIFPEYQAETKVKYVPRGDFQHSGYSSSVGSASTKGKHILRVESVFSSVENNVLKIQMIETDRSIDPLIDWLIDGLIDWLDERSFDWLIGWFIRIIVFASGVLAETALCPFCGSEMLVQHKSESSSASVTPEEESSPSPSSPIATGNLEPPIAPPTRQRSSSVVILNSEPSDFDETILASSVRSPIREMFSPDAASPLDHSSLHERQNSSEETLFSVLSVDSAMQLLRSRSGKGEPGQLEWRYDDYGAVDHRLRLYVDMNVLTDAAEKFALLAKVGFMSTKTITLHEAVVVISNSRIYVNRVSEQIARSVESDFSQKKILFIHAGFLFGFLFGFFFGENFFFIAFFLTHLIPHNIFILFHEEYSVVWQFFRRRSMWELAVSLAHSWDPGPKHKHRTLSHATTFYGFSIKTIQWWRSEI